MRVIAAVLAALVGLAVVGSAPAATHAQQGGQGTIRVLHAAPDATNVDMYIDDRLVLSNAEYFSMSFPMPVAAGTHTVRVAPTGQGPGAAVITETVEIGGGDAVTFGVFGNDGNYSARVFRDDLGPVEPGQARVRLIHASPALGPVDIRAAGTTGPHLTGLTYSTAAYMDVPAGVYAFDVMPAGSSESVLRSLDLRLLSGWTYTLVVTGENNRNIWVQAVVDRTTEQ